MRKKQKVGEEIIQKFCIDIENRLQNKIDDMQNKIKHKFDTAKFQLEK